jgi:hypothetical protein
VFSYFAERHHFLVVQASAPEKNKPWLHCRLLYFVLNSELNKISGNFSMKFRRNNTSWPVMGKKVFILVVLQIQIKFQTDPDLLSKYCGRNRIRIYS